MSYEPREYWENRVVAQGPSYVGPGGNVEKTIAQAGRFQRSIDEALTGKSFNHILDFGCGVGRFVDVLAKHADHVTAVDLSATAIELAGDIITAKNIHLIHLSEDSIPLLDDSVDLVVAVTVFQHIVDDDDWALWTSEINRVLNPTGALLVIDGRDKPRSTPLHPHVRTRIPDVFGQVFSRSTVELPTPDHHWMGFII